MPGRANERRNTTPSSVPATRSVVWSRFTSAAASASRGRTDSPNHRRLERAVPIAKEDADGVAVGARHPTSCIAITDCRSATTTATGVVPVL